MNKKLIAAAVSAAVVAPVAAYGEATVYGSIRNALDINDVSATGDGTTDISGVSSRFGIKYSQSMGNGLTAHGKYEFSTTTDKEKANANDPKDGDDAKHGTSGGVEDTRVATVGISGAFGRVDVGNQWSSYFNTFGSLISPTYTLGYYLYTGVGGGVLRSSNTIKYSNSYGPLSFELDVRFNGSDETADTAEGIRGDGIGLGLRFAVNDNLTIAAAFDNETGVDDQPADSANSLTEGDDPDSDRVGIAAKYAFGGDYWASLGWQNYTVDDNERKTGDNEVDITSTFLYVGGNFSESTNWLVGRSMADDGDDAANTDDSSQLTWGVYHSLGGGMKLFYESASPDSENKGWDGARHLLGMRVNF